jgi:poly(3-hydroxybutyrate) depolymerase
MGDPESAFVPREDSNDSEGDDSVNDLFYITKLISEVESKYCINNRRIYATGLGTGGGLVHRLACQPQTSRKVAAYAIVGGAFYKPEGKKEDPFWSTCNIGRRPIPILEIHGEQDDMYPLAAKKRKNKDYMAVEDWVKQWRDLNKCGNIVGKSAFSKSQNTTVFQELKTGQLAESLVFGGGAIKQTYRCGIWRDRRNDDFTKEEKEQWRLSVVHYIIRNFKHGWPRVKVEEKTEVEFKGRKVKPVGNPNVDASSIVLNFFNHHRLPDSHIIQSQARSLFIERGAPKRDGKNLPKDIPIPHGEL